MTSYQERSNSKGTLPISKSVNYLVVEAGGTTFKLSFQSVASHEEISLDKLTLDPLIVPTTNPRETMQIIEGHVRKYMQEHGKIFAVGIACFGPIQLNHRKENYGSITSTPKKEWRNFNIVDALRQIIQCDRIAFDTDVNAPALLESKLSGCGNVAYITVGTGVGVGLVVNGKTVHGLVHPEGGHIFVPIKDEDTFSGVCPYHGNCVEGMITSVAIKERCNLSELHELEKLGDDDPVWDTVSHYLAHLCVNLLFMNSIERIVLGGGVMERKCLFPKVREQFTRIVNGYIQNEKLEQLGEYIVEPFYGSKAGIAGAFALVLEAYESKSFSEAE